jgi:hypothetical protein
MTLILSGTDGLSDVDGSAATPAIRGTDANTGIFFGADIIGFAEGGAEVARFNADAQFVAAAGTASLPVITTTGDVNTGIFFPAADTIAFAEGGVESMRIDASQNVIIGASATDSGAKTRVVFGALQNGLQIKDSNNTSNASFLIFQNGSNSNFATISRDGTNNSLSIGTVSAITFPATQVASAGANTLDDYEEGTWTPTVNSVNLGAVGRYTKVGRLVSISFSNQSGITGIAVNATMTCSGIPFNVVGGLWDNTAAALVVWNNESTGYPDELACGRLANSSLVSMTNKGSETTTTSDPWGLSVVYFTS